MSRWKDGNNAIFQQAQKVHGWGRIHAADRINPDNEEIRRWFLLDGVHNDVMPSYSALVCWKKSDAETLFRKGPSREEFSGIRDILEGLLDEGPVRGISRIENSEEVIRLFLSEAENQELELRDYEVIFAILQHTDDENSQTAAKNLLFTDSCRTAVMEAIRKGKDISLAAYLDLDYKPVLFERMKTSFADSYAQCGALMSDDAYRDQVIDLFRNHLPLKEMRNEPKKCLGLGKEYEKERALEFLIQELKRYPMTGMEFVETALQSEPTRTRNGGLNVLESWVDSAGKPLREILPEIQDLLGRLCEKEPDETVRERMNQLRSGCVSFEQNQYTKKPRFRGSESNI